MANSTSTPTNKQLTYLRKLAYRTGTSFTPPRSRRQASAEIRRLKQIAATGFTFAELQAEQAARHAHDDVPLAFAIHDFEVDGYAGNCSWSQRS